jgi:hypothetical protein
MGGNVSRILRINNARDTRLIRLMATVRFPQRHSRNAHARNQTTMATVVTPESGPVGL